MRASAGLADLVVADSPDGVIAFDRECRYTVWNAAMERLSGVPASTAIGRVAFELFPFLVETGEDRCFREALAGRVTTSFDRPFVIPETGRSGFYEARYAPLYGPGGAVIGGLAIVRDVAGVVRHVTEQVRAERDAAVAHQRAERALRLQALVLERMGEGVTVANEYGTIVYTNPTTDHMFGYRPGELVGRHMTILTTHPANENALTAAEVIDRLRTDGFWQGEWRNVKKDGTPFITQTRITTLEVEGRPHWFCVQEDVTERRRAEQRKTFLEVATRLLNETLDYQQTLQALTRHCLPFLADYCSVDILTDDGEIRRVETAHVDPEKEQILRGLWTRYPYRVTDRVGVPEALRTRAPVLVSTFPDEAIKAFARDEQHLAALRRLAPRSYMCVPLIARERPYGALSFVMSDSGRRYTPSDLELAVELARRAATAIDNARLYTAEHAARARAAFLSDASALLASSLDYEATLASVARAVVPDLADWCSVEIVDEDDAGNRSLRRLAVAHVDPTKVEWANRFRERYPSRLDDPQSGVANVIRTGKPEMYPQVTDDMLRQAARDEEHLATLRELGLASVIIAPLTSRGRTLGAVSFVAAESGRRYTADDLALAVELARRAATAVDNARLFREAQAARAVAEQAERRVAFLARASAELASSLDVGATLRTIARLAVPDLADWCFVELLEDLDGGTGLLKPVAVQHSDPEKVKLGWDVMTRYPLRPDNEFGSINVMRTGEPELVAQVPDEVFVHVAHDPEHLRLLREVGFRSTLQVPLRIRGRVVGVLTFASDGEQGRRFDAADLALAEEISARAGVALENARLYAAERAAREEAEAARTAAEEANRAKSEFLAVMSHELRTPLNAIGGYAELIDLGIRGPVTPEQREDLQRIQASQKHLLGLINEVLNYARVESGAIGYKLAEVPVGEVVRTAEALVAPQVRSKGLVLERSMCVPDDLAAHADREKVQQILLNLLSNAVKFTDRGGRIQVCCDAASDRVRIKVRDTGIGIPAEKLDSIFEPFVQIGRALNRPTEGTGLGLAISRDLARGMGGDLSAESELGVGSTITLALPKAD
ncbi:MAG: GAF domain-containing protein [Gemmatimonadaceae bacterium]